ncbi:Hypothetical protein A7982_00819 [Minicystis rosea]|nr:Hypothetical protein A7982_00819 [Minicystis rosea]
MRFSLHGLARAALAVWAPSSAGCHCASSRRSFTLPNDA